MENKLKLGVLGLGEGRSIISAALSSKYWDIGMLCDLNEELGRMRCREFGIDKFTTSLEEMLNNPQIDVIGIYTPDSVHAEHIRMCLEAGKHVICTKPFLNDLSEAGDILDQVHTSGKHVMVGQSTRFFEPFIRQKAHFDAGEFGDIISVETQYNADHRWFLDKPWAKKDSFKWLFGGLSHPADLLRWYLPGIDEVMGYASLSETGKKYGLKNHDTFQFIAKTKQGKPGRISGTYSSPVLPYGREGEINCTLRCANGASVADYPVLRYA